MKKLMFMLATIVCAAVVQASTVKWNVSNIYGVDAEGAGQTASSSRPAAGAYYVLCMLTSEMSLADAQTAISKNDIASIAAKATFKGTTTGTGLYASSYYDGGWGADQTVEIYAVVLNASSIDKATFAAVSSATTSYTYADSAEDKSLQVNMKTVTQGAWSAVAAPEPTSGLLMLLGIAGLALKRKRA